MLTIFTGIQEAMSKVEPLKTLQEVTNEISRDPVLQICESSPGAKVQATARQLNPLMANLHWTEFAAYVVENLINLIGMKVQTKYTHKGTLDMLQKLTEFSMSTDLLSLLQKHVAIDGLTVEVDVLQNFLQHIRERMFPLLTKMVVTSHEVDSGIYNPSEITAEEEQVLYYCAGYVQRSLLVRLQRRNHNVAAQLYIPIVKGWGINSDSDHNVKTVPPSLTEWLNLRNRGGLIEVTGEFYLFMNGVERALRPLLQFNFERFRDIDMVSSVMVELKENKVVLGLWKDLCGYELVEKCDGSSEHMEQLSEGLFEEVVKRWTATRGRHMLKTIIFSKKLSKTASLARMGEASMRRSLDKQ